MARVTGIMLSANRLLQEVKKGTYLLSAQTPLQFRNFFKSWTDLLGAEGKRLWTERPYVDPKSVAVWHCDNFTTHAKEGCNKIIDVSRITLVSKQETAMTELTCEQILSGKYVFASASWSEIAQQLERAIPSLLWRSGHKPTKYPSNGYYTAVTENKLHGTYGLTDTHVLVKTLRIVGSCSDIPTYETPFPGGWEPKKGEMVYLVGLSATNIGAYSDEGRAVGKRGRIYTTTNIRDLERDVELNLPGVKRCYKLKALRPVPENNTQKFWDAEELLDQITKTNSKNPTLYLQAKTEESWTSFITRFEDALQEKLRWISNDFAGECYYDDEPVYYENNANYTRLARSSQSLAEKRGGSVLNVETIQFAGKQETISYRPTPNTRNKYKEGAARYRMQQTTSCKHTKLKTRRIAGGFICIERFGVFGCGVLLDEIPQDGEVRCVDGAYITTLPKDLYDEIKKNG